MSRADQDAAVARQAREQIEYNAARERGLSPAEARRAAKAVTVEKKKPG